MASIMLECFFFVSSSFATISLQVACMQQTMHIVYWWWPWACTASGCSRREFLHHMFHGCNEPGICMHQHHAGRCHCHEKIPKKRSNQMAVSSGVKRACMYQHASGLQASCQVDLNQAKLNSMLVKIYVAMCYYLCSWFYLSPSIYICAFTTIVATYIFSSDDENIKRVHN